MNTNRTAWSGFANPGGNFLIDGIRAGDYWVEIRVESIPIRRIEVHYDGSSQQLPVVYLDSRNPEAVGSSETVDWHDLTLPAKAQRAFRRGLIELNKNNRARRSIKHFKQAIRHYPEYCAAYLQWAVALFEIGDQEETLGVLDRARKICPQNPHVAAFLGKVYLSKGLVREAIPVLLAAVNQNDAIWNGHRDLSRGFLLTKQFHKAHEHAEKAHALRPEDPGSHILLYRSLAALERYDQALAELEEILARFESDPIAAETRQERQRLIQFLQESQIQGEKPPPSS